MGHSENLENNRVQSGFFWVWNTLPFHINTKENLQAFKDVIKFWDGSKYSCNICFDSNA